MYLSTALILSMVEYSHSPFPMAVRRSLKAGTNVPTLRQLRPVVLKITRKHGASNVRVFGSFMRGEQTKRSDLDLLVRLPTHMSLIDLIGLKRDLEQALGRKVDVLTDSGISRYLRDRILQEAKPL
jgi:predicted nucleotidyltransferase